MNNCLITLFFVICSFGSARAQQFYVKPYVRYHQSVATQNAPQYFTLTLLTPYGSNSSVDIDVWTQINKFSLAGGMKYGGCFGYQFDNIIGVEAGIDYFKTNKKIMADPAGYAPTGMTQWKYQAVQASPVFTFRKSNKKSSLVGKAGMIIGIAWLQNTVTASSSHETYQLNKNLSLGYTLGIEYDLKMSPQSSFVIEGGLEHSSYTPKKAKLTAIGGVNQYSLQDQKKGVKEINYVNQIKNIPVFFNPYGNSYTYDQDKPEVRIKQAIKLSSAYLGVGIKYNFNKK
jgi:hypothetical protein